MMGKGGSQEAESTDYLPRDRRCPEQKIFIYKLYREGVLCGINAKLSVSSLHLGLTSGDQENVNSRSLPSINLVSHRWRVLKRRNGFRVRCSSDRLNPMERLLH